MSPWEGEPIIITGWVQEYLFREFLAAVCDALGATLDDHTWQTVRGMVDWSEADDRTVGSCLRKAWAGCVLVGRSEATCEFSLESVASWVLVRIDTSDAAEPRIRDAMLYAQRVRE